MRKRINLLVVFVFWLSLTACAHSQERSIIPNHVIESTVWDAVRNIGSKNGRAVREYGNQWILAEVKKRYEDWDSKYHPGPVNCYEVLVSINGMPHHSFYKVCLSCGTAI